MSDHDLEGRAVSRLISTEPADRAASTSRAVAERDPIDRVSCRLGDASCASAHAASVSRSASGQQSSVHRSLLRLQRQYGNQYVGQALRQASAGEHDGGSMDAIERSIDQARGGGHGMDHGTRTQMESAFGADFSGVRIHADTRADGLSQSLSARAFATGRDVFFRQGEYNPGTSSGRELLAHELTHVVQQNGDGIRRKVTVSEPGDAHEVEAEQMAKAVVQREHHSADGTVHEIAHTVQQRSDSAVQGKLIQADSEGDVAPPATAGTQTTSQTGAPATTVDTIWNINFIDQFAGTGTKVEGRKDTTSLYVKQLKVAPDGEAGKPAPTPKIFSGVTLAATGRSEMGSFTHPKDKGGKVSSSVAYGAKPTFDFTIKTVDYDPKTASKEEKKEAAEAKAMNSGAAHKEVVKKLTKALDTFVDEAEAQAVLTSIVNDYFKNISVEATIKMTNAKTTTPINTTDLNYGSLSADKTFNLVVKIPNVTKDKSSAYTTIKGGEVTKGVETSKEEGKEKGVATKSTIETEFIQSYESAFMSELKTAAEKVKTSANIDEKSTTHTGKMTVKNSTSAKLSGDISGGAELDLSKIPLAGKVLGKLLNAKVNINLKPDLSDTFELEHSSTDEDSKKTIKSEESKVRNELSTAMQSSVKNLWSSKLKTSVETSTHETTTEKTGEKKNVSEKTNESSSATSTTGTVTIVASAVQPVLAEE